jgi:hypothetical protein
MKIILSLIISGALVVSGFGQTRNVLVGTNNTVVQPTNFWSADASNARSGLGLGSAATNPASAFQPSSSALSNIVSGDGSSLSNLAASNIVGVLTLSRGGTSATNAESARSSLGLSFSALTNTNSSTFRSAIGLSAAWLTNTSITNFRSDIGLGLSALTNTNIVNFRSAILPSYSGNTNKVLAVNSNGTDIEWVTQTGGGSITSGIIAITNGGTGATNAAQARTNLGLGATNIVQFRRLEVLSGTNASIWLQDESRIEGDGVLYLNAGELFLEVAPEFGGTNANFLQATTRTNLGLGATWLTNTNVTNFRTAIGLGSSDSVQFDEVFSQSFEATAGGTNYIRFNSESISFGTPSLAATTRTNVGLPLAALTNTNNASFIQAVLPSYTGNQSKVLALNSSANGLEWVAGGSGLAIPIAIVNGGTGATNAETARTNLGLGAAWLTNTVLTSFRTDIGLGAANAVTFGSANILGALSVTGAVTFGEPAQTRTNLGLGATWLTNTNTTNFLTAIKAESMWNTALTTFNSSNETNYITGGGKKLIASVFINTLLTNLTLWLPNTNESNFGDIVTININSAYSAAFDLQIKAIVPNFGTTNSLETITNSDTSRHYEYQPLTGWTEIFPEVVYDNGATMKINKRSSPTVAGLTINGTLYGLKTNVGPFEGVGNFFASNNTTLSNETLFRVGLAEATNRSAQFGFRVARTNNGGEGFAVFSVFGYNALMMIGPSDRSRTNTATNAGIEADIFSISPTNKVMTLITTNTGAMQMHRPIGFNTNASAPTNTTNVVGWIEFYVGTNSVRVPYYQ